MKELWISTPVFIVLVLGLFRPVRKAMGGGIETVDRWCGVMFPPLAFLMTAAAFALRYINPDLPPFEGGNIVRMFYASQPPLKNLVLSVDTRHPGLYYALIHYPMVLSGHSVQVVRTVGVVFSTASVLILGLLVKRLAGPLYALLGMALLAVAPEYIFRSREITDLSLFVMLGLMSMYFYQRVLDENRTRDKVLLAFAMGLTLMSSLTGPCVWAALLFHALTSLKRLKTFWAAFLASVVIGTPGFARILVSLPSELSGKKVSSFFPKHFWGSTGSSDLIKWSYNIFYTHYLELIVTIAAAAAVVLCWKRLKDSLLSIYMVLFNLLFLAGGFAFRLQSYYALFIQPAFFVFLASLHGKISREKAASFWGFAGTAVSIFALVIAAVSYSYDLAGERYEGIYVREMDFKNDVSNVIDRVKKDGGRVLVQDMSHDKAVLVYHFFDKPFETMDELHGGTGQHPLELHDKGSDKAVFLLSEGAALYPGWEQDSFNRFKGILAEHPLHLIYIKQWSNAPLYAFLREKCRERMNTELQILFQCDRGV